LSSASSFSSTFLSNPFPFRGGVSRFFLPGVSPEHYSYDRERKGGSKFKKNCRPFFAKICLKLQKCRNLQ